MEEVKTDLMAYTFDELREEILSRAEMGAVAGRDPKWIINRDKLNSEVLKRLQSDVDLQVIPCRGQSDAEVFQKEA